MDIGSLSIILIVGLLLLISIGVPMGFASGFMGAVLVFLYMFGSATKNQIMVECFSNLATTDKIINLLVKGMLSLLQKLEYLLNYIDILN